MFFLRQTVLSFPKHTDLGASKSPVTTNTFESGAMPEPRAKETFSKGTTVQDRNDSDAMRQSLTFETFIRQEGLCRLITRFPVLI